MKTFTISALLLLASLAFLPATSHALVPQEEAYSQWAAANLQADAGDCSGSYCIPKGTRGLVCEYVKLPDGNCKTECRMVESCGDSF